MNLIRQLRLHANVTQQELATRAATSQSTIAAYEAGTKSPTLRTVQKLVSSLDLEWFATFAPRMTREDHRSLAFHRAIADVLSDNPMPNVNRARRNLTKLGRLHPHARSLLMHWETWLDLPTDELISRMLDPGVTAREMRHVSPFSGMLKPEERVRILKEFRKEHAL